jgi:hypothetical protein
MEPSCRPRYPGAGSERGRTAPDFPRSPHHVREPCDRPRDERDSPIPFSSCRQDPARTETRPHHYIYADDPRNADPGSVISLCSASAVGGRRGPFHPVVDERQHVSVAVVHDVDVTLVERLPRQLDTLLALGITQRLGLRELNQLVLRRVVEKAERRGRSADYLAYGVTDGGRRVVVAIAWEE